jgi:hypothetical protein
MATQATIGGNDRKFFEQWKAIRCTKFQIEHYNISLSIKNV